MYIFRFTDIFLCAANSPMNLIYSRSFSRSIFATAFKHTAVNKMNGWVHLAVRISGCITGMKLIWEVSKISVKSQNTYKNLTTNKMNKNVMVDDAQNYSSI